MADWPFSLVEAVEDTAPWTYTSQREMACAAAVAILHALGDEGYLLIAESGGTDPVNPELVADELERFR